MDILIISDEPQRSTFRQIENLKRELLELCENKVDLCILSNNCIFFNQRKVDVYLTDIIDFLERILREKIYDVIAISLELRNLQKLFQKKRNICDLIMNVTPQTVTFVFGGSSVLSKFGKDKTVQFYLYSRSGVSKLKREFKNDIIEYIIRRETNG